MNKVPQQYDTQYLEPNMSSIFTTSQKQVAQLFELLMKPAIKLHRPDIRKHLSPTYLRWAVAMKKQAIGQATISETLRIICSTKMFILNLSMPELGPMQRQLRKKNRHARFTVLLFRDLNLNKSLIANPAFLWSCCRCSFFSSITFSTSSSVIWHSKPLIAAIFLKLFRTAPLPFLQRQFGVSYRQKTITNSSTKAGSVQKYTVTTLQLLSQQQPKETRTPATPNAHWRINEYFCLSLQSTISLNKAIVILILDSQPAPAISIPTLAVNMLRLRVMRTKPATALDQVSIMPNLLPKLSEKCMKTKQPTNTPKKRVILYVAMLDSLPQWQSPSQVTNDSISLGPSYFSHQFEGSAQTQLLHCCWLAMLAQTNWFGSSRKATPRIRKAVMNHRPKNNMKMWRWYLPLVPTRSSKMKNQPQLWCDVISSIFCSEEIINQSIQSLSHLQISNLIKR